METKLEIRVQFNEEPLFDSEHFVSESPVVSGQALTGAELFRRMSSGLPVGCAVRNFDQINPYLEKFSIYDAIGQFKIRHGMVDSEMLNESSSAPESGESAKNEPSPEG